jgi:hypothetical protein
MQRRGESRVAPGYEKSALDVGTAAVVARNQLALTILVNGQANHLGLKKQLLFFLHGVHATFCLSGDVAPFDSDGSSTGLGMKTYDRHERAVKPMEHVSLTR